MPFLTIADLKTHLHEEVLNEITRDDSEISQTAIAAGIAEAKGFMNRYDLVALFGDEDNEPAVTDLNLKSKVKDLVRWQLINLGCTNIDYAHAENMYTLAIEKYFMLLQVGKLNPQGWPYADTTTAPAPAEGNTIEYSSNPKRTHHF